MSISHRDIKPENVIITVDGTLKLVDFSCSGRVDKIGYNTLGICGTPFYMPPELRLSWKSKTTTQNYDPFRADIYSIGAMVSILLMKNKARPEEQMLEI